MVVEVLNAHAGTMYETGRLEVDVDGGREATTSPLSLSAPSSPTVGRIISFSSTSSSLSPKTISSISGAFIDEKGPDS